MSRSVSGLLVDASTPATAPVFSSTKDQQFFDRHAAVPLFRSPETRLTVHRQYFTSSGEEFAKDGC